jgi:hypothetical protein
METLIAGLFAARDVAHRLHLRTRSFAAHMALGGLYDELVDLADALAESYQGKYGLLNLKAADFTFPETDAQLFIKELATWAESAKGAIRPDDTHLLNEWDNVITLIYKTKYKLETLV